MVFGAFNGHRIDAEDTAVLYAVLGIAGIADGDLLHGHLGGIVNAVLPRAVHGQILDLSGAVGIVDAILDRTADGHAVQLDGAVVIDTLITYGADRQAADLRAAAVIVDTVAHGIGHGQLLRGEGAVIVDAVVLRTADLDIRHSNRAAVLDAVLARTGLVDLDIGQRELSHIVDAMLRGAGDGHIFQRSLAIGVVNAVLAGAADLQISDLDGAIVVHALCSRITDGQVRKFGIAAIVVHTVVLCAVDGDVLGCQLAGVIHTMVLRAGDIGLGHGHGAVVLDTVAVRTGIADGHIGDGHIGLVIDAVLPHIFNNGVGNGDHAACLIVDAVHARVGNGHILDFHHGIVVDALLARAGDRHILQHQLVVAFDQIEAVGIHIRKGTVGDGQRALRHIAAVVSGTGDLRIGHGGCTGQVLHRVFLDFFDGNAIGGNFAALIVDTVAAQIFHGHVIRNDLTAVNLETVLACILDVHIVQLYIAARVQLDRGGADIFNGAVVHDQVAAEGVNTVLFIGSTLDLDVIQHGFAVAYYNRLVTAHIQYRAVDGHIAACVGDIAVPAAFHGQVIELHVTGEVIHRAGVTADGSELVSNDLAAVVGQAVDLAGIHSGALNVQDAGAVVHDSALVQCHCTGIGGTVVAQAVGAVGDGATGHIGSCILRNQHTVLSRAVIDTAGHGKAAGGHIDIVHSGLFDGAAGLGQSAVRIHRGAGSSTGNRTAGDGHCTVVDDVIALAFHHAAALDIQRCLFAYHQVGVAAVLHQRIAGHGQLGAALQDNAVDIALGVDTRAAAEGKAGTVADGEHRGHGLSILSLHSRTANAPRRVRAVRPGRVRGFLQQDFARAGDGLGSVHHQRFADDHITGQLNGVRTLRRKTASQLTAVLLRRQAVTEEDRGTASCHQCQHHSNRHDDPELLLSAFLFRGRLSFFHR